MDKKNYEKQAALFLILGALVFILRYIPFFKDELTNGSINMSSGMAVCNPANHNIITLVFSQSYCSFLPMVNGLAWVLIGVFLIIAVYFGVKSIYLANSQQQKEVIQDVSIKSSAKKSKVNAVSNVSANKEVETKESSGGSEIVLADEAGIAALIFVVLIIIVIVITYLL